MRVLSTQRAQICFWLTPPVLLSRISGKHEAQQATLSFRSGQGQGLDLGLNPQLSPVISKLLIDAVVRADWNIKLNVDPDLAAPLDKLN